MNHRFLTEEQKRRNRRERLRRNRCQKASRRREAALLRLHESVLLTSPFVSALTCTELLNQPRVAAVRGLVRRLNRIDTTLPDPEQTAGAGQNIPRPRRTLWMRNRGIVPEPVRQPVINNQEFLGVEKALERARDLLSTHNQVQILDFLTTPNGPFFNLAEQLMVLPDQLFEGFRATATAALLRPRRAATGPTSATG